MIWIFDLDETLYDEKTFVLSGLRYVAPFLSLNSQYSEGEMFDFMQDEFNSDGRAKIFQHLKKTFVDFEFETEKLIEVYRSQEPNLKLYEDAKNLLSSLSNYSIYLVTDGNRMTQWSKINALGINAVFKKIFVTDEHGVEAKKPHLKCFELIKALEKCEWQNMVYVGDDPHKDFINLKPLGMRTVRVNRGRFFNVILDEKYEADLVVNDLDELKLKIANPDFI